MFQYFVLYFALSLYEPPHDKTNKIACVPSEYSDQPAQSDQSLRCPHKERFGP